MAQGRGRKRRGWTGLAGVVMLVAIAVVAARLERELRQSVRVARAAGAGAGELPPGVARLSISSARGVPGQAEPVRLVVRAIVDAPLRRLSLGIDFDETALELVSVGSLLDVGEPAPVEPEFHFGVIVDNEVVGEGLAAHGFAALDLEAAQADGVLAIEPGVETELVELIFALRPEARPGLARVDFRAVGPVEADGLLAMVVNRVELAGAEPGAEAIDLHAADLRGGGIHIIGEIGFFLRGDVDLDCHRDISDPILTLRFLFRSGAEPPCLDAADADDSGAIDLADAVYSLRWLFSAGSDYHAPYRTLGEDPTADELDCVEGYDGPGACSSLDRLPEFEFGNDAGPDEGTE